MGKKKKKKLKNAKNVNIDPPVQIPIDEKALSYLPPAVRHDFINKVLMRYPSLQVGKMEETNVRYDYDKKRHEFVNLVVLKVTQPKIKNEIKNTLTRIAVEFKEKNDSIIILGPKLPKPEEVVKPRGLTEKKAPPAPVYEVEKEITVEEEGPSYDPQKGYLHYLVIPEEVLPGKDKTERVIEVPTSVNLSIIKDFLKKNGYKEKGDVLENEKLKIIVKVE
ncbi:MAG: hypothetical protein QXI58_06465, partial [Candidatus Micrarchaeia archaeon]